MQRATEASTRSLDTLPAMTRVREGARRSPQQLNCSPQRGEHRACRGSCLPTTTQRAACGSARKPSMRPSARRRSSVARARRARGAVAISAQAVAERKKGENESFQQVCRDRKSMPGKARDKGAKGAGVRAGGSTWKPPTRLVELNGAACRTPRVDCDVGS